MPHIELKTVEQLRWMREAGLVVASIHEALRAAVRPGVTTRELDEVSAQAIADGGGTSNFLGYYGYPATVCISVNDVIVHGIPGDYELAPGDIVTDPRSQAYYIVTEYGGVNLVGCSTWERAEKLISIAHPMFRDELIANAEKQGIWIKSNKR